CGFIKPYSPSTEIVFRKSIQYESDITRLRKPFITLKDSISFTWACKYSPSSFAVSSGFFLEYETNGNTTMVKSPSNSSRVGCKAIFNLAISALYNSTAAFFTDPDMSCSMFGMSCLIPAKVPKKKNQQAIRYKPVRCSVMLNLFQHLI